MCCQVEGDELAELGKLYDSVYEQAAVWFSSLKETLKTQILSHFGNLPLKDPDPQVLICLRGNLYDITSTLCDICGNICRF